MDLLDRRNTRAKRNLSEMAFHEKSGRSQVNSGFILWDKLLSVCPPPLSPCFHPHAHGAIRSLGACWAFSFQPVLPSVWRPVVSRKSGTWARPLTQSPELGFGLLSFFSSWNNFDFVLFYAAAATVMRLLLCKGSSTSPLTHS
jgi:hypothetical protein